MLDNCGTLTLCQSGTLRPRPLLRPREYNQLTPVSTGTGDDHPSDASAPQRAARPVVEGGNADFEKARFADGRERPVDDGECRAGGESPSGEYRHLAVGRERWETCVRFVESVL